MDTVAGLNGTVLRHFTDRDPGTLGHRLRSDIDLILRLSADRDPDDPVAWLGGARVPVVGLLAHLTNELLIHGWDIARAGRVPWVIPPRDAGSFLEMFVVGLMRNGYGHLLDNDEPPRDRRIAVEFRSRYTSPVTLVLQHGRVTAEEPGPAPDVRLSFNPATLNLMMFGRISKLRAVLGGGLVVSGRRPWLLPTFLRTVRMPG